MADPEGRQLSRGVRQPIILQKFCRKLHENEKNLDCEGDAIPGAPLDPQLITIKILGHVIEENYVALIDSTTCFRLMGC